MDDATLGLLNRGAPVDPNFREMLATLSNLMRLPRGLDPDLDGAMEMLRQTLAPAMADFRTTAESMFEDSGLSEIIPAIDSGIVELSRFRNR